MSDKKKRPLIERLRDLLDSLKDVIEPRRPAPVPVPVRDDRLRRR